MGVLSGYPDSTGGSPGRRQRFRSDTHELDFRGTCEPGCPRPEDREPCSYAGSSLCRPRCVRDCEPCAFGSAFVISYMWSRGANPELVNRGTGFLIPFSLLWGVFTGFFIKTKRKSRFDLSTCFSFNKRVVPRLSLSPSAAGTHGAPRPGGVGPRCLWMLSSLQAHSRKG